MLAYKSGMIGLPLRLLAREVYQSVVSRVGAQSVALVTGEERIVPARPRYWVATVEAMPGGPAQSVSCVYCGIVAGYRTIAVFLPDITHKSSPAYLPICNTGNEFQKTGLKSSALLRQCKRRH